ncbi:CubicO group peptidase (beta-lactamase class C family) [Sphingomonas naasensis]|uniref:Serine hydrolase n=1 Tax=Sphingomonas naasensis TaxID=1344951 RepID=A0A4S1WJV6_9SPHN|nr:serine hydrolase [Sphingomonas naasensis]NIJ21042.1 CubicO group peptidase (beta-lactamase class C family) [Sphingomonas naasensis]TGX43419.1 serine hydrolase [Sphingomonas naasensis]
MKLRPLLALPLLALASPALADPPAGLDAKVETLRKAIGAPGIAVAVVEHGKTTLAKGWGVRKLGEAARVDADTIFPTGSTGKAFTAAALAILVDQGKIGWDDRVIDHMPWFRMYDPWVTREMTIRDLLVHHSGLGLGAGDLLFVPRGSLSRKETVERLAYIKPATSFRSGYAYDNILYTVAGQLIEEVSGKTWEEFVTREVLRRGGMGSATATYEARRATADRAFPHARIGGAVRGDGPNSVLDEREELGRAAMPAGGLALSAKDLAQWLKIQLGHGALPGGGRLFSEAQAAEMWKGVTVQPITPYPGSLAPLTPKFSTYALGWEVEDYKGARIISHGGGVFGSITHVILLPDQDVGIAVVVNSEDVALLRGVAHLLVDHYLGLPDQDWPARFGEFMDKRVAGGKAALAAVKAAPAKVGPSLPLERYAGTYRDAWYGDVAVTSGGDGLRIDFKTTPRMAGRLVHWQYDTFVTRFDDKAIEPAYVTFALDAEGKIARVAMKAESPIADFSYDYQDLDLRPVEAGK